MKTYLLTRSLETLPDALKAPEGWRGHGWEATSREGWNWIHQGAGTPFPPEDVDTDLAFFSASYTNDVAACCAVRQGDEAEICALAAHPWRKGLHYGRLALDLALRALAERGVKTVRIRLPEEAGAAIHTALSLGFEPDLPDEAARGDWAKVMEAQRAWTAQAVRPIPLWEGLAPYSQAGDFQPSLMPFPVEGSRGAVVVCPGGGYAMKASHEGDAVARMLNAAGISAYVLDYRVKPCHYEAPLADVKRAMRTVRAMGLYERVGVMGFSAGGHLCVCAATMYDGGDPAAEDPIERMTSRPDVFIPCYSVVSFIDRPHQGTVNNLLGDLAGDEALLKRFSGELHVTADTPPAFMWHTAADQAVPVWNSLNLAKALSAAGVPFELHIFPEGQHGLGLAVQDPTVRQWSGLCQDWLLRQGFGRA